MSDLPYRIFYALNVGFLVGMGLVAWRGDPADGALCTVCIAALIYVFDKEGDFGS